MTSHPQHTTKPTLPNVPPALNINLPGLGNASRKKDSQQGVQHASGSHINMSRRVPGWERKTLPPVVANPNLLPHPPWQAKAKEPKSPTTMDLILANAAAKSRDPAAHAFFPRRQERYAAGFGRRKPAWSRR